MWHCFVHFCYKMYTEVALLELFEESHHPVFNFLKGSFSQKKPVHCSFQGKWFSSLVVLASLWWSTRCSFLCSVVYLCVYGYILNTLHDLIYVATMHAWIQLAIAMAYVLMYYYGNTTNSIGRDLTINLSFMIISVWLFWRVKMFWNSILKAPNFQNFLGGMLPDPLVLACFAASVLRTL